MKELRINSLMGNLDIKNKDENKRINEQINKNIESKKKKK